jgi:hypothetical protein
MMSFIGFVYMLLFVVATIVIAEGCRIHIEREEKA